LFSLKWGSARKTVIYSPSLIESLNASKDSVINKEFGPKNLLEKGFAMPRIPYPDLYRLDKELEQMLSNKQKSEELVKQGILRVERQLPSLVSFLASPIDQQPWERMAGTFLMEDGKTIETGLL
jgi:hypothetical protein